MVKKNRVKYFMAAALLLPLFLFLQHVFAKEEEKVVLTADMPVEELLKKMTVDFAKEIVIDYGIDKGKTLGKLAQERPQGVQYHASKAKNNLIRAGAMFLLEQAKVA